MMPFDRRSRFRTTGSRRRGVGSLECLALAGLCAAAVAYGSLLPFKFHGVPTHFFSLSVLQPPWRTGTSVEDIVTNLVVYFPVGFTGAWLLRTVLRHSRIAVAATTFACAGLSLFVENLQSAIPERVPSWMDLAINTAGGFAGAMTLGLGPAILRLLSPFWRTRIQDRPLHVLAVLGAFALLLSQLFPFDFIRSSEGLHNAFRRADWSIPVVISTRGSHTEVSRIVNELPMAAWFAAWAGIVALDRRSRGRTGFSSLSGAVWETGILATIIECTQLLVQSHVFECSAILMRVAAAIIGAAMGTAHAERLVAAPWRQRPALLVPTPAILLFAALHAAPFGITILGFAESAASHAFQSPSFALPFVAAWRGSMASAAGRFLGDALSVAGLAIPISILARRAGFNRPWFMAFVTTLSLWLIATVADAVRSEHRLDVTHLIWASFTALILSRAYPAARTRFYYALNAA